MKYEHDFGGRRPLRNCRRGVLLTLLIASGMLLGAVSAPAQADTLLFQANSESLGEIPAGGDCSNPLDVTFDVNTPDAALTDVSVIFLLSPAHTWVGDVTVQLLAPGGAASHTIFDFSLQPDENSDLSGYYEFSDTSPESPTWLEAAQNVDGSTAVPASSYRASNVNAENTLITPSFAGLDDANGTWTLRFCDRVTADTGTVAVASLHLTTASVPPPVCEVGAPCARESDTATQDTIVDVTAAPTEGVLNIEVSQATVDFGSVQEGTSSSATSVGTLTYTNTLGANRSWDVTVAATDLVKGTDRIGFENLSFDAGDTITPAGPTVPITGSTAFSGEDHDGFSDPHPLANAPSTAQGTFTHAGITATLSVPFGTPAGTDYSGTLQYTITG